VRTADFDYALPPEQVAAFPPERRDASRLCVLNRKTGACEEAIFSDIGRWLRAGDLLVANNSRVIPARLIGELRGTRGKVEMLLTEPVNETDWLVLCRPAKKLKPDTAVLFGESLRATVLGHRGRGERLVRFEGDGDLRTLMATHGLPPLPPYILECRSHRTDLPADVAALDRDRYQTVYARDDGSVAAPTAGLHFTEPLIASLRAQGVEWAEVTLHVGPGTFLPVRADDPSEHAMHEERYLIEAATAAQINRARDEGRRVIPIGTTALRVLESVCDESGRASARAGATNLFILPGHRFRSADAMITNFHLPRSTLLMLVCAFAEREKTLSAYQWAIERGFRLFSYGDAMLIV
jgi:S-adenosylmethionine:tRNA ribosyltransferase-isomerase